MLIRIWCRMKVMNSLKIVRYEVYIMYFLVFSFIIACDNSDELTPRIEDVFDTNIVIPTSRLTYEEQDALEAERAIFDQAVADRAGEE